MIYPLLLSITYVRTYVRTSSYFFLEIGKHVRRYPFHYVRTFVGMYVGSYLTVLYFLSIATVANKLHNGEESLCWYTVSTVVPMVLL